MRKRKPLHTSAAIGWGRRGKEEGREGERGREEGRERGGGKRGGKEEGRERGEGERGGKTELPTFVQAKTLEACSRFFHEKNISTREILSIRGK